MQPSRTLPQLPTGLPGRALALGIPAMLLLLFIFGIVLPLADFWRDLDAEYTGLASQVSQQEQLIARKAKLAAEVSSLQAELEEGLDFLPKAEPAMAAAQVQVDLGALVERSGANLRSTLTLPTKAADGFTAVGSQLSVSGSMRAVRDILYGIESGRPRLVIDRLTIGPSQEGSSDVKPGDVDITIELHGYMIGEVAP
jgi:hypothetical protein